MASVFWTMCVAKIIVKFYTVTTKWKFLIAFQGQCLIDIGFNLNPAPWTLFLQTFSSFCPRPPTEDINRYMGSVNFVPINIQEDNFETEGGKFDPSKLDFDNPEKHKIREAVLRVLRKVVDLSNSNLVMNADGLLVTRPLNKNIEWVGESGQCVPENLYALSYWLFFLYSV